MRVHPEIADLRDDRTIMCRAQGAAIAAARTWRRRPRIAPILSELEQYGQGSSLSACPQLAELFHAGPAAGGFAGSLCVSQCAALADERFAQVPFRHAYAKGMATLLIGLAGSAQLTLVSIEPGKYPATCAVLSDAVRHEAVLAGEGTALRLERRGDRFESLELQLSPGSRLTLDLARLALPIVEVRRRLVILRLARTSPDPAPTREYDIASGKLIHQASGDIRASRHEMMLALLGRMGRSEAAGEMVEIAREQRDTSLRWQALREALALDTAAGFAALCSIARDAGDSLAMPAGALLARLIEDHPELASLETAQCRA